MSLSQSEHVILGIDPGSRVTGFGVIGGSGHRFRYLSSGCIRCAKGELTERLKQLFVDVQSILEQWRPNGVAIESVFMHKNADGALKLGQARGVIIGAVAAFDVDLPIFSYTPREIKNAAVGYGAAKKNQIQYMMKTLFGLAAEPQSDAADALAAAVCHWHTQLGTQGYPRQPKAIA